MSGPPSSTSIPRALPRGRHAAARRVVLASQRGRLLEAVAACVADRGYQATSVADVIARAGVSRKTFYEHFADKRDCFLAAWRLSVDALVAEMLESAERESEWTARLRAGTRAFLQLLAAEPEAARSFVIGVLGAGEEALEARSAVQRRFADLLRTAQAASGLPAPPAYVFLAATGAAWELIVEQLRRHGPAALPELEDRILAVHLALLRGRYPSTGD